MAPLLALVAGLAAAAAEPRPPIGHDKQAGLGNGGGQAPALRSRSGLNIVFVLLDNLGQEWFGAYGSEEGATPNIDALARGGVRFEHCYTHPVCGPSRVMLLTGRYPFRTGWTMHHDAALYSGGGLDPRREVVVARLLKQAGYVTGIAGKWQVNNVYDEPGVLARHGFDEQLVWPGSVDRDRVGADELRRYWQAVRASSVEGTVPVIQKIESRYWDPVLMRNGRRQVSRGRFGPDVVQEFALDFIKRHRSRPFFLYYPMLLTHGQTFTQPVVPTPLDRRADRPHKEMFADMVRYGDKLVGDLVKHLEALGLRDRTILFVASDNGTESQITARRNGREVKGGLYTLTEAGGSVAFLVSSPALVPAGRVASLMDFTDVYPTLVELAGAKLPAGVTLDGRSLVPLLLGQTSASPRDFIFTQFGERRVVRDGRFKLYSTGELYDVMKDREERANLAASTETAVVAARDRLRQQLASLPPDTKLPFEVRSQSMFKMRAQQAANRVKPP